MAFRSEFSQKVDRKARVSVPAAFRPDIQSGDPGFGPGKRARFVTIDEALAANLDLLFWLLLRRALSILSEPGIRPYRALLLALMVWPLLYMVVNAMRTSAPGLAVGMAFLTVLPALAPGQKEWFAR